MSTLVKVPSASCCLTAWGFSKFWRGFITWAVELWRNDIEVSVYDPSLNEINCVCSSVTLIWSRVRSRHNGDQTERLSFGESLLIEGDHCWGGALVDFDVEDNTWVWSWDVWHISDDFLKRCRIEDTGSISATDSHPGFATLVTNEDWAAPSATGSIIFDSSWNISVASEGDTNIWASWLGATAPVPWVVSNNISCLRDWENSGDNCDGEFHS